MREFSYCEPVEIVFEKGGLNKNLAKKLDKLGVRKPFVVVDRFFAENGFLDNIFRLADFVGEFHDISQNPKLDEVKSAAELILSSSSDGVVAIGGGSTLDLAKAASCLAASGGNADDYFEGKLSFCKKLPTILVPTTSGTGSEVTKVAVLTKGEKKTPVVSNLFFANVAIVDPTLTYSLPPKSIAVCGLDALCHALEGFYSKYHQPICDLYAMEAAKIILENLRDAYAKKETALDALSFASNLAGLAFALPKTAAPHGISFALTTKFNMPHGEACAFTADKMLVINKDAENGRLLRLADFCGFSSVEALAEEISSLKKEFGLKRTLEEAGISIDDIPFLVKSAKNANTANNPVEMTEERLFDLFLSLK